MTGFNRRNTLAMLGAGGVAAAAAGLALPQSLLAALSQGPQGRRKFLFIAIDDLRPMMGHYGDEGIITPHFDGFAGHALSFDNAYTQVATCGASRGALFTALRPETTSMLTHLERITEKAPGRPYLHSSFKAAGFTTTAMGKVLHFANDAADGWSEPHYTVPKVRAEGIPDEMQLVSSALDPESGRIWAEDTLTQRDGSKRRQPVAEAANVPDSSYPDGQMADYAIDRLARFAQSDEAFFMAVGFSRPHLPFNAPKKYWDLYDREKIALTPRPTRADGAPPYAVTNGGELSPYAGLPVIGAGLSEENTRYLTHGYMACVSYVDAQVGKVIDAVRALGMWEDTVICLWGDHGFKLGDYNSWTKHSNYEIDTRVPLMLRVPGLTEGGERTDAMVETVDVFPSLLDLAGIAVPEGLEGISFATLLADPKKPWKSASFSQFDRGQHGAKLTGYAVRTRHHRYVMWKDNATGAIAAEELYDHRNDPLEMRNIAGDPAQAESLRQLRALREQGWQAALPPGSPV